METLINANEARALNPNYIRAMKRFEEQNEKLNRCIKEASERGVRQVKIFFPDYGISQVEEVEARLEDNGFLCKLIYREDTTEHGLSITWQLFDFFHNLLYNKYMKGRKKYE